MDSFQGMTLIIGFDFNVKMVIRSSLIWVYIACLELSDPHFTIRLNPLQLLLIGLVTTKGIKGDRQGIVAYPTEIPVNPTGARKCFT